ncbi:unnamed protein product [Caenorhabditis sp. 36 PRJEB53466]|nr:unnamed protein product [Caenorhabditis sp. 36 PRJEB53466]
MSKAIVLLLLLLLAVSFLAIDAEKLSRDENAKRIASCGVLPKTSQRKIVEGMYRTVKIPWALDITYGPQTMAMTGTLISPRHAVIHVLSVFKDWKWLNLRDGEPMKPAEECRNGEMDVTKTGLLISVRYLVGDKRKQAKVVKATYFGLCDATKGPWGIVLVEFASNVPMTPVCTPTEESLLYDDQLEPGSVLRAHGPIAWSENRKQAKVSVGICEHPDEICTSGGLTTFDYGGPLTGVTPDGRVAAFGIHMTAWGDKTTPSRHMALWNYMPRICKHSGEPRELPGQPMPQDKTPSAEDQDEQDHRDQPERQDSQETRELLPVPVAFRRRPQAPQSVPEACCQEGRRVDFLILNSLNLCILLN